MGVCTTRVAALQVGRMFIGIEIEEEISWDGKGKDLENCRAGNEKSNSLRESF